MSSPQPALSSSTYRVYTKPLLEEPIPHPGRGWTRFVCVSDTHRKFIPMVDGDVLIHAGDFTTFTQGFRSAVNWIKELRHPQKVLIAGNHEFNLDKRCRNRYANHPEVIAELDEDRRVLTDQSAVGANLTYLEATSALIPGGPVSEKKWSIYGSPYTPEYGTMGFSYPSDQEDAVWAEIPPDTQILVTHGPPSGILDISRSGRKHVGCPALARAVLERLPHARLHVFGHIHEGRGVEVHRGSAGQDIIFVNAACRDLRHPLPIIVDLKDYPEDRPTPGDISH